MNEMLFLFVILLSTGVNILLFSMCLKFRGSLTELNQNFTRLSEIARSYGEELEKSRERELALQEELKKAQNCDSNKRRKR